MKFLFSKGENLDLLSYILEEANFMLTLIARLLGIPKHISFVVFFRTCLLKAYENFNSLRTAHSQELKNIYQNPHYFHGNV